MIAPHHAAAPDHDLAVVGDLDLGARERRSDRTESHGPRVVDEAGRAGLGQAVALQHQQPGRVEPLLHLTVQAPQSRRRRT